MNPESTVSENDAVITYEELVIWAENYAKELIGKECVAIMCDSEMAAAMSMLACFAADVTAVPISKRYGVNHYTRILKRLKPEWIITDCYGELKVIKIDDGDYKIPEKKPALIMFTSGTTGKRVVAYYTQEDIDLWNDCCARALAAAGAGPEDVCQVAYGYGLFTGGFGGVQGGQQLGAMVIPMSSGNTQRQIMMMRELGTTVLCCTPSYATYLGETIREMGLDPKKDLHLKAGCFGAEPWTENMRKEIERMLDIKAYDIYGLSEIAGPGVAFDCECQCGLHINEDFFYPEIIDPETGKVLPDGEVGELVFTCIGKEALPLIRYRTRDIASLTHEKCACGRTLVRMTKPKGRSDDMLIIRGINVFPSQVEHVLTELGLIPNYQIVVDRKNNLDIMEVKVELADRAGFDTVKELEAYAKTIENALQSTLNIHAKVTLVEPMSLPRSEGKAKRVIDNRNII